jgi:hypothetical protein
MYTTVQGVPKLLKNFKAISANVRYKRDQKGQGFVVAVVGLFHQSVTNQIRIPFKFHNN